MKPITHLSHTLIALVVAGALVLAACGTPDSIPPGETRAAPAGSLHARDTAGLLPVSASLRQDAVPTPTLPPGVTFGPIVGPDIDAQPLPPPLPGLPSERPCPVTITAPEATLVAGPERSAALVGTVAAGQQLTVSEIVTDGEGLRWASTEAGWLLLGDGGTQYAALGNLRSCAILAGDEPATALLGLHVLNWASQGQVLGMVQRLAEAGRPMAALKGLNGSEITLNEAKRISPETVIIFRSILNGGNPGDCPNPDGDPVTTARAWIDSLQEHWTQVNADYYEVSNECGASTEWLAGFLIAAMQVADEYGQCLLMFSYPAGAPEIGEYEKLIPVFEYALANPCQSGRLHGVAMHAYTGYVEGRLSDADVGLAYRHRLAYDYLKQRVPNITDVPVYYTEAGQGWGYTIESCEDITIDAIQYIHQLELDPYVKGVNLWNVGTIPNVSWVDLTPCLGTLTSSLVAYYGQ